ncbi:hypothetical protein AC1031_001526 [Aphanomyces cochlioides]|nr:hypothetical protein AC1031_001526 [Aphanomyces cochlioides]
MAENREQLKAWLAAWVNTYIDQQGGPNYMEVTLLQDDYGRRRGCVELTNRTHMLSQEAYIHTNRLMTEEIDDEIVYIIQEQNVLKLKRISVSGVFPGYPGQDRITVTHAGISLDARFPFLLKEKLDPADFNGFSLVDDVV